MQTQLCDHWHLSPKSLRVFSEKQRKCNKYAFVVSFVLNLIQLLLIRDNNLGQNNHVHKEQSVFVLQRHNFLGFFSFSFLIYICTYFQKKFHLKNYTLSFVAPTSGSGKIGFPYNNCCQSLLQGRVAVTYCFHMQGFLEVSASHHTQWDSPKVPART